MDEVCYRKKLLVLGDTQVGKTCLFHSYTRQTFPSDYIPSVFEGYVASIQIECSKRCELAFWDTSGNEAYAHFRPLSYSYTDIIMLCFSLNDPTSYRHVEEKWYEEINEYIPGVPIILVGTKLDLREDKEYATTQQQTAAVVTMEEGLQMKMKNNNVVKYMECSALTLYGVNELFEEAARTACSYKQPTQRTRRCLLF